MALFRPHYLRPRLELIENAQLVLSRQSEGKPAAAESGERSKSCNAVPRLEFFGYTFVGAMPKRCSSWNGGGM
jgi:hypothetical protein